MKWTDQERATLRELLPTKTRREIADLLGRPMPSLRDQMRRLGLKKQEQPRPWADADKALLHALLPSLGLLDTAKTLNRPVLGVKAMAARLGISTMTTQRHLPLGTERLICGRMFRKVSMDKRGLENWKSVHSLEECPELRELYQLLAQVEMATRELAKSQTPAP